MLICLGALSPNQQIMMLHTQIRGRKTHTLQSDFSSIHLAHRYELMAFAYGASNLDIAPSLFVSVTCSEGTFVSQSQVVYTQQMIWVAPGRFETKLLVFCRTLQAGSSRCRSRHMSGTRSRGSCLWCRTMQDHWVRVKSYLQEGLGTWCLAEWTYGFLWGLSSQLHAHL